jgi:hypothetical protein
VTLLTSPAVLAQEQEEEEPLAMSGRVVGELRKGSRITFRMTATAPGGFRDLSELSVTLLLHGIPLEELTVNLDDNAISASGGQAVGRILVGTANVLTGAFFRVSGLDVSTTTSGNTLSLTLHARLLQPVPQGARFGLTALDDFGKEVSVTRAAILPPPPEEGFPWAALGAAVVGALFAGGFLGNLFASRRRAPHGPSIYGAVQRRLEEDRTRR